MRGAFTYEGIRYYVSGKDEEEIAVKKALRLKELAEGVAIQSNMTVCDWSKEWLTTYKAGTCNQKTYKDYVARLDKYILPKLGNKKLKNIKPIDIQNVLQGISKMSQSRINKMYQCMHQMFSAAVGNGLIEKNPVEYTTKPKGTAGSHRSITDRERQVILEVAKTHKYGLWVKLMLFCGLRTGETGQVKVAHFDFDKQLLYIDGTKTKNAKRYVPVPQEILDEVKALNKEPFDYLFTNNAGKKLQPTNSVKRWRSFKKAMHVHMGGKTYRDAIVPPHMVAEDLVPYCLRHTFCTDLQDAGVPINIAKELMGHSDISLTAKIYTHYTDTALNNAAELMLKFREKCK